MIEKIIRHLRSKKEDIDFSSLEVEDGISPKTKAKKIFRNELDRIIDELSYLSLKSYVQYISNDGLSLLEDWHWQHETPPVLRRALRNHFRGGVEPSPSQIHTVLREYRYRRTDIQSDKIIHIYEEWE